MKTLGVIAVFLSLLLASPLVWAKGKGQGQGTESRSGWEKGEKKGWDSTAPPGLEEKDEAMPPGLSKDKQQEGEEAQETDSEESQPSGKKEKKQEKEKHREKNQHREKQQNQEVEKNQ
jgi:hypothetical protein